MKQTKQDIIDEIWDYTNSSVDIWENYWLATDIVAIEINKELRKMNKAKLEETLKEIEERLK